MINFSMELAIIKKDLRSITSNKNIVITLLVVPFVFSVFLPSIFIIMCYFAPEQAGDFQKLLDLAYSNNAIKAYPGQEILMLVFNQILPVFFMIIPIMSASIMSASSFVGEKEKRTLETLLYSPLSIKRIFNAKVMASFILSMIVSWSSFILMIIVSEIEVWATTGQIIIPNIGMWKVVMLLLVPALSLITITIIVRGSAKAKSFEESQQKAVFLVLPIIALVIGQFAGLLLIDKWILFAVSAVLMVTALIAISRSVGKMDYESILK